MAWAAYVEQLGWYRQQPPPSGGAGSNIFSGETHWYAFTKMRKMRLITIR